MTESEQVDAVQAQIRNVLTEAAQTYGDRVAFGGLVTAAASMVAANEFRGVSALACWHRTFSLVYDTALGYQ